MESCTNPLMMCTDAAARTKNIRLGQACNVITFHNPIRLAEDIATLDQMSKGRVEVGIGRGVYGREAINMNKEADLKDQAKNFRLFSETLEIMKKAWSEDFFSHQLLVILVEMVSDKVLVILPTGTRNLILSF